MKFITSDMISHDPLMQIKVHNISFHNVVQSINIKFNRQNDTTHH